MPEPSPHDSAAQRISAGGVPAPPGQSPQETALDGNHGTVVQPKSGAPREFPPSTEVFFVNGILTNFATEKSYTQAYADNIGGPVRMIHVATASTPGHTASGAAKDLETATLEKLGRSNNPPENAVESEVLKHLHGNTFEGDVHFMAHSRGALVTQRGLERVAAKLEQDGWSAADVRDRVFSHVTVETIGGASTGMPDGVRCVHYVNGHDIVANNLGMGTPSARDQRALAGLAGISGLSPLGAIAVGGAEAKLAYDRAHAHPQGPVIDVPPVSLPKPLTTGGDISENHHFPQYLAHREPFEATYQSWDKHGRIAHADPFDPSRIQSHIDRTPAERLPAVQEVAPWNGRRTFGPFVKLDEDHAVQSLGRGTYAAFDIARDLHGIVPPPGVVARVDEHGHVTSPEPHVNGVSR